MLSPELGLSRRPTLCPLLFSLLSLSVPGLTQPLFFTYDLSHSVSLSTVNVIMCLSLNLPSYYFIFYLCYLMHLLF